MCLKTSFAQIPNLNHDEPEENIEIDIDIDDEEEAPTKMGGNGGQMSAPYLGLDINIPSHDESDDEIPDVDVNDDSAGKTGPIAAEAVNEDSSSSSDSSGSGSSGSGSPSRSGSSSDSSDDDSASSAGELDI